MDRYSLRTRKWLDLRFDPKLVELVGHNYEPYQPVHGIAEGSWTPGHYMMAARWAWMIEVLRATNASSFIDVGGAEGYVAHLVRSLHTKNSTSTDISISACERANEYFSIGTLASEAHRLPFDDDAYDVVYCAEVIEHLAHPVETLLELKRVARVAVVVASEEGVRDEEARREELDQRALADHMDRTIICASDFNLLYPDWNVHVFGQCNSVPESIPQTESELVDSLSLALRMDDYRTALSANGLIAVMIADEQPARLGQGLHESVRDVVKFALNQSSDPGNGPDSSTAAHLPKRRCVVCATDINLQQDLTCSNCATVYEEQGSIEDYVVLSDVDSESKFLERLRREFPDSPERIQKCLDLQRLLDFPLAPTVITLRLPMSIDAGWKCPETCQLSSHENGGLTLFSDSPDPCIISPDLHFDLEELHGIRVQLSVIQSHSDQELMQVFFRTLNRPLWWEAASSTATYPATQQACSVDIGLPSRDLFGEKDVLTGIRIDPSHGDSHIHLLAVELF